MICWHTQFQRATGIEGRVSSVGTPLLQLNVLPGRLRVRGTDESPHREARLKPAQQEPAASEFHGLKPGGEGLGVKPWKWHGLPARECSAGIPACIPSTWARCPCHLIGSAGMNHLSRCFRKPSHIWYTVARVAATLPERCPGLPGFSRHCLLATAFRRWYGRRGACLSQPALAGLFDRRVHPKIRHRIREAQR